MTKIKLSNGTTFNVNSVDSGCISVVMNDLTAIATYVDTFTKENLSKIEVLDESDNVTSTFKDKCLYNFDGTPIVELEDYIVCFNIRDVYTLEEKIARLEEENAKLNEAMKELLSV